MKPRTIRNSLGLLLIVAAGLLLTPQALATSASRQAYAARAEPICRSTTPATERLLHGTREMANHGQAVAAGRRFIRASNLFAGTVRRLAQVIPPPPDAALLGRWLKKLGVVKLKLRNIGAALKQHNRLRALNGVGELRDAGTEANRVVRGFGFRYCRIVDSRFS
jgi:hypothetical protein